MWWPQGFLDFPGFLPYYQYVEKAVSRPWLFQPSVGQNMFRPTFRNDRSFPLRQFRRRVHAAPTSPFASGLIGDGLNLLT